MEKRKKSVIASAIIFILVGALIFGAGLGISVWKYESGDYEDKVFDAFGGRPIESFDISLVSKNVELIPAESGFRIEYSEKENRKLEISFENGKLTVRETRIKAKWWLPDWLGLVDLIKDIGEKTLFRAYLPAGIIGDGKLSTVSGDSSLSGFSFDGGFSAEAVSGNIRIKDIGVSKNLVLSATSGKIILENLSVLGDLKVSAVSGSVSIDGANVGKRAKIDTVSGNIKFSGFSAPETRLEVVSGNIDGTFTSPKSQYAIEISKVAGKSNVAEQSGPTSNPKYIIIDTVSGDINLKFAD